MIYSFLSYLLHTYVPATGGVVIIYVDMLPALMEFIISPGLDGEDK